MSPRPAENAVLWALVVVKTFTTPGVTFLTTGEKLVRPPKSRVMGRSSTGGGIERFGFWFLCKCHCRTSQHDRAAQRDRGQPIAHSLK